MRILQLCGDTGIAPGATKGAAQHLRGIAAGLADLGHDVITVTTREPEGPFPVTVHPLRYLGSRPDLAWMGEVDVIYERYSLGHRLGLELARRLGRPLVLEVNAPLVDEARTHRPDTLSPGAVREAAVEAELLTEADLVIAVSRPLERWVRQRRTGPTISLSNGFEPSWFETPAHVRGDGAGPLVKEAPAATRFPTADGSPALSNRPLVFIGHPKPWHGADRLPRLLSALDERGHVLSLLVIGGGPGVTTLMGQAERLGVADRITITGSLPPWKASRRLAGGLIGLAPYRRLDPFYFCPLKIVDYLAAGLPVVATDQGDVADLVGTAGLVVDPDDDDALADAVASLIVDPYRRAAMADAGHRRAHAELTWSQVAARTVDEIEATVAEAALQ